MLIGNIQLEKNPNYTHVAADIGPYPLWFRISAGYEVDPSDASAFLISALTPAMLLGEDIEVDSNYYVSERLYQKLPEIMAIIHEFNPIFKLITVSARTNAQLPQKNGCAAFFSAGVDSIYTAVKHQDEIDALILINGFDFNMESDTWQDLIARNKQLAKLLNKKLILVETNLKEFNSWFFLMRRANFGATLATIANLLDFAKVHISGSATYSTLTPDGSHPMLDPLWSTEVCNIVHTGLEADRTKKIEYFKDSPEIYSKLWVCWKDPRTNCGHCSKCIRSYIALRICGIEDFEFQHPVTINKIKQLSIDSDTTLTFFEYFDKFAHQDDLKIFRKQFRRMILKYKFKVFLKEIDKYLFDSKFFNARNRSRGIENDLATVSVFPRYTDDIMQSKAVKKYSQSSAIQSTEIIGTAFSQS